MEENMTRTTKKYFQENRDALIKRQIDLKKKKNKDLDIFLRKLNNHLESFEELQTSLRDGHATSIKITQNIRKIVSDFLGNKK